MRPHSDQVAAIALVAFAALAFGLTYGFDEVPKAIQQGMGPERFPRLVAVAIMVMAAVLLVTSIGKPQQALPRVDRAVYVVIAGALGFMGAMWLVGLPVAMGMALVALGVLWGERRWGAMLANAVILPALIWAMFVKGLKVPLPVGVVGRWLGL